MQQLTRYKTILWDFDGVIMDSMPIRDLGFKKTLESFPEEQVQKLLDYHQENGGLSRYVKFRYFFENIRNEKITESEIEELAEQFSVIMLNLLINKELLILDTVNFIKENYRKFNFHIVSGSDGNELIKICKGIDLDQYFLSIKGSPLPKKQLIENILREYDYPRDEMCLIGDSQNDADAAIHNEIDFFAYNNEKLKNYNYINTFLE